MKNCDEMVNSLLERREQYAVEQKRKKKAAIQAVSALGCFALVAAIGVGVWQSGLLDAPPATLDDSTVIGEQDYFADAPQSQPSSGDTNADGVGNYPEGYVPNGNELTMISSFDVTDEFTIYVPPENGDVGVSIPLRRAMQEYGEEGVLYRVFIDVFCDAQVLSADDPRVKAEADRLSEAGYTVAYETYFDGAAYHYYFTIHARWSELTEFAASEHYGYMLFLYDERVETNQ